MPARSMIILYPTFIQILTKHIERRAVLGLVRKFTESKPSAFKIAFIIP